MSLLSQAAAQADIQELAIPKEHLVTDGKTQARLKLNPATVAEYADLLGTCLEEGSPWPFPPVKVIRQAHMGAHFDYVWDGFHRTAAAHQAHWPHPIPALVRPGTQRDAVLAAVGANADHGLRRTNADKRRAVEMLLKDDEWRTWSDRAIAEQCKVTHPFVGAIRKELYPVPVGAKTAPTGNGYQSAARKGKDGRTIDTRNIGSNSSAPVPPLSVDEAIQVIYDVVTTVAGRGGVLANALDRLERTPWDRYKYAAARPLDDATIKAALGWVRRKIEKKIQPPKPDPASQSGSTRSENAQTGKSDTPDPRPRFTNSLTVIAGMFSPADEDIWADAQGNTHLSDLRFLVEKMLKELSE